VFEDVAEVIQKPGAWALMLALISLAAATATGLHVLLKKRDARSSAYWLVIVMFVPLLGSLFYLLFGINSIRRQGRKLRKAPPGIVSVEAGVFSPLPSDLDPSMSETDCHLAQTLDRISRFHFTIGNSVRVLHNGDEALTTMVAAIEGAKTSVTLASYIFESTGIGAEFVGVLERAVQRGVVVKVMVDDAGTRYGWPPVTRELRRVGVTVRRFMPNRFIKRLVTLNLRNHRKVMVVDGVLGFTGGMNIREGNMLSRDPDHPVQDLHFEIRGPVVQQLQDVFAEDWEFCCGEVLEGETFYPEPVEEGRTSALGLPDGPDADLEVMPTALFAALNAARQSVRIVTPYFLPGPTLMGALNLCALRGVEVTIITPAKNNIPLVSWAAWTLYPELMDRGCRIFESPPPFDHSKVFVVDEVWSFVGSTNWDPRSLRLNFEFNVVCYDVELGARLTQEVALKQAKSVEVTRGMLDELSFGVRLRNGLARLFIPLL
jgi:cardiolipin synthase A/B